LYPGGGAVAIAVVFSPLVDLVKETTTGNGVDERAENGDGDVVMWDFSPSSEF
jgi:hypothetical protein